MRYDLHRFFSLRSSSGQAAAALYHLDQWTKKVDLSTMKDVKAEIDTEVADPGLAAFVKQQFHIANVQTGTLHAGTKCCTDLHYKSTPFHAAAPTFAEDIVIPWEGKRLLDAVQQAASKIAAGGRKSSWLPASVKAPSSAASSPRNCSKCSDRKPTSKCSARSSRATAG